MAAKALFWFLLTGKVLFTIKQATIIVPAYHHEVDKSKAARDKALDMCGNNSGLREQINAININPAPMTLRNLGLFIKGLWRLHIRKSPLQRAFTSVVMLAVAIFVAYEVVLHWSFVRTFIIWSIVAAVFIVAMNYIKALKALRFKLTHTMSRMGVRIARFVKSVIHEQEVFESARGEGSATNKTAAS